MLRRESFAPALVIGAAALVRVTGALHGTITDRFPDSASYWTTADSLDGGAGFARRPPLYPLLLQLCRGVAAVTPLGPIRVAGLVQVAASIAAMWLVWQILERVVERRAVALIALGVVCAYAPMWDFDRTILSEAIATPLAVLTIWGVVRDRPLVAMTAAAALGLTKTSAAAVSLGVAVALLLEMRRARRPRDEIVRVVAATIGLALGGQLLWFAYGTVAIDGFTMTPANADYGSYANARYCGFDIDAGVPGASEAELRVQRTLPPLANRAAASSARMFGREVAASYKAVSAISSESAVGEAARRAQLDDPLRLVGCSIAKASRAVVESAVSYPTLDPRFHDDPGWFREPAERIRAAAVALAPILTFVGLLGLVVAAACGVPRAASLLVVVVAQLLWLGLFANGQLELFRLRGTIDVALLTGVFLLADGRVREGLRDGMGDVVAWASRGRRAAQDVRR